MFISRSSRAPLALAPRDEHDKHALVSRRIRRTPPGQSSAWALSTLADNPTRRMVLLLVADHAAATESDDSRHQTALPGNTARQHRQTIKAPLVRTDSVSDDKTLMQFPPLPLSSRISAADSRHRPYDSCGSSKPRPHAAHAGVDITGKRRATSSPTQGGA